MAIYINGRRVGFRIPVTSASVVQPTVALEKTITGDFANTVEWSTEVSNIRVIIAQNHSEETTLTGRDYYLVLDILDKSYIFSCSSDGIEISEYDATIGYSLEYQWHGNTVNSSMQLKNLATNMYAYVTANGELKVSSVAQFGAFKIVNNHLHYEYIAGDTWVPYRGGSTAVYIRKDKATSGGVPYTAFLYAASYPRTSGSKTVTLTPISDENGTLAGDDRFLVIITTSGSYYTLGSNSSTAFVTAQIKSPNFDPDTGALTYKTSDPVSTLDKYRIKVEGSNGHYTLKFNSGTYFTPPSGNPKTYVQGNSSFKYTLNANMSDITYNDERGVYLSGGADLGPFGISSVTIGFPMTSHAAGDTAGGSTVLYHWDGSTWQECRTAPEPGETYAMVIRKYDADVPDDPNAHYFLVTYNGSALSGVDLGTEKELIPSQITSDARFVWDDGQIRYGFEYLTANSILALAKTKPYNAWVYVVNEDPALNRMWMCSNVQRKMYAIYANNKKL